MYGASIQHAYLEVTLLYCSNSEVIKSILVLLYLQITIFQCKKNDDKLALRIASQLGLVGIVAQWYGVDRCQQTNAVVRPLLKCLCRLTFHPPLSDGWQNKLSTFRLRNNNKWRRGCGWQQATVGLTAHVG